MFNRYKAVLRNPDLAKLLVGQAVSQFGDSVFVIALAWYVADTTGSAVIVANIMVLSQISRIISSAFAGVIVDRYSRKLIMIISDLIRSFFVLVFALILYLQTAEIWHMNLLAVILGVVGAFFSPAEMSIIPDIVDRKDLNTANSLNISTKTISHMLGPVAAGILIALPGVGMSGVSLLDSASFLAGAFGLSLIRKGSLRRQQEPLVKPSFIQAIIDGIRYVRSYPVYAKLIVFAAFLNFIAMPIFVLLPLFAKNIIKVGSGGFGFMEGSMAAGLLAGAIAAGFIIGDRKGVHILTLCIFNGMLLTALSLSSSLMTAIPVLFLYGMVNSITNTIFISMLQRKIADEYRGRVFSLISLVSSGLQPISIALSGIFAERTGIVPVMLASGLCLTVISAVGLLFSDLRRME